MVSRRFVDFEAAVFYDSDERRGSGSWRYVFFGAEEETCRSREIGFNQTTQLPAAFTPFGYAHAARRQRRQTPIRAGEAAVRRSAYLKPIKAARLSSRHE